MDRDYTKEQGSLTEKRSQGPSRPGGRRDFPKSFCARSYLFFLCYYITERGGAFLGRAVRGSSRTVREPSPSTEGLRSTLIY